MAMVLCAVTNQPMLATRFTDVLFRQISPTMRHALGVPKPPGSARPPWMRRLLSQRPDPVPRPDRPDGPLPGPEEPPARRRGTSPSPVELRRLMHTDEERAMRGDRLAWFINEILEMSIRALPREVVRKWKGSAAVDATVVPAFARPARRVKRKKKGKKPATLRHSS